LGGFIFISIIQIEEEYDDSTEKAKDTSLASESGSVETNGFDE